MSKDSFVFYTKYKDALLMLSDRDRSDILIGCIEYVSTGEVPPFLDPSASLLFTLIRQDIDEDKRKYEEVCERNRQKVNKRWHKGNDSIPQYTTEYHGIPMNTVDTDKDKDEDKEWDKDKDRDKDISTVRSISFMPDQAEQKRQISDLTKITLSRMGGAS